MPSCYSKKYKYIIKYHPKSGCSLFRQFFLELHKDEVLKNKPISHHICAKLFPYKNEEVPLKINLVRNPYTRVVSMFTNKMCTKQQGVLNKTIKLEKHTFYHFVKYLYDNVDNLHKMNKHLHLQSNNYEDDDVIVKLESFQSDIVDVYNRPNYIQLMPKVNNFFNKPKTAYNVTKRHQDVGFIGTVEYTPDSKGPWSLYEYFYNDEIKNMVYEIYKKDFELFNYDIDSI